MIQGIFLTYAILGSLGAGVRCRARLGGGPPNMDQARFSEGLSGACVGLILGRGCMPVGGRGFHKMTVRRIICVYIYIDMYTYL